MPRSGRIRATSPFAHLLKMLQEIMGYASITTTLDVYGIYIQVKWTAMPTGSDSAAGDAREATIRPNDNTDRSRSSDDTNLILVADPLLVSSGGRVVDLGKVVLYPAGDSDEQQPGLAFSSVKGVREPARQENKAARGRLEHVISTQSRYCALKHIEALVLARVNVARRPLADDRLHHRQHAAGRCRRSLHIRTAAANSRTWADNVSRKIWHESDYGSGPSAPVDINKSVSSAGRVAVRLRLMCGTVASVDV